MYGRTHRCGDGVCDRWYSLNGACLIQEAHNLHPATMASVYLAAPGSYAAVLLLVRQETEGSDKLCELLHSAHSAA